MSIKSILKYDDPYNIALSYLVSKYPAEKFITPSAFDKLAKAKNKKEREKILRSLTNDDFSQTFNINAIKDMKDKHIALLVDQYFADRSNKTKTELKQALERLGLME